MAEYIFTGENISQMEKLSIKPVSNVENNNNKKKINGINSINTELLNLDDALKQRVISLRSIVTSKEAGAIIGKGGKNVKEVRELASVKAGVSKVVENVNERILTVTGTLDNIAKAYSLFAGYLIDNNNMTNGNSIRYHNGVKVQSDRIPIHLLVSHLLLGSIFGKNGENIKEIQELSSAYIVVSREMLPQSTERVIEIIGNVDSIHIAVYHIIVSILKDIERSTNAILYQPSVNDKEKIKEFLNISSNHSNQNRSNSNNNNKNTNSNNSGNNNNNNNNEKRNNNNSSSSKSSNNSSNGGGNKDNNNKKDTVEVHFKVPSHLVGCTIGKKGATIAEIRQVSGSKISISPITSDNKTERTFTLVGTEKSNEKALSMILQLLKAEAEKAKKEQSKEEQGNDQEEEEEDQEENNQENQDKTEKEQIEKE